MKFWKIVRAACQIWSISAVIWVILEKHTNQEIESNPGIRLVLHPQILKDGSHGWFPMPIKADSCAHSVPTDTNGVKTAAR